MKKKTISLIFGILICISGLFYILSIDLEKQSNLHKGKFNTQPDSLLELKSSKKGYFSVTTVADADAFVESGSASINFGDYDWVYIGRDPIYGNDEGYYRFSLSDKPDNYVNACVSLNFNGVNKTYNFPVYLIETSWDELSITWSNKPAYGELITTLTVSSSGIYQINVTKYIEGRSEISICVSYDSSIMDYIWTESREDDSAALDERPQLIWNYEAELGFNITSPKSTDKYNYGDHKITWESIGVSSLISIQLYNNSIYVENITDITNNDGEFIWNIPKSANYSGDKYQIKLIDYADNQINNYSDFFEIMLFRNPSTIISNGGGGGDGGGDGEESSIPFGYLYIIFIAIGIILGVSYSKKKVISMRK